MNKTSTKFDKLDKIGSFLSFGCAIHCLIFPFLITFGSFAAIGDRLHHFSELIFLVCTLALGTWSVKTSYAHHRNKTPIALITLSVAILLVAKGLSLHAYEMVVNVGAALLIAIAHQLNMRLNRKATAYGI